MADFDNAQLLKAIDELARRNHVAAFELLLPLADAGNPKAQCNLATLYHLGLGVKADGRKAVDLYLKVAEQDIREEHLSGIAYNNLATIYSTGLPGIERDGEKSKEYLARARKLGFEM
jgi:uncharacterized protein